MYTRRKDRAATPDTAPTKIVRPTIEVTAANCHGVNEASVSDERYPQQPSVQAKGGLA